ncbi:MAG: hypothetical protein IE931_11840 [Sphingobacteriales bacterium]|nr:hypothetical protein [Sphingobacteriales bacterium]
MKKLMLAFIALLLSINFVEAQNNCKVLVKELQGSYEGDCKKEKAEGTGTAKGIDKYSGEFKKGFPDGKGTYTFANGDIYIGSFVKGKFDGEGTLTYIDKNKKPKKGFWDKGEFVGKYKEPYKVYFRTSHVSGINASPNLNVQDKDVYISISSTNGNNPVSLSNGVVKSSLSEIIPVNGTFTRFVKFNETTKKTTYKIQQVAFPLRVRLRIGDQEVEIEFFEDCRWDCDISLNQ